MLGCKVQTCKSEADKDACISGKKPPQVSEGFIMCWLHYDSQVGPLEALHDLPDAH